MGFGGADDAAVYKISDDRALVMTTDFFPPMVDDPYQFGEVAAANALSDVFAMGGRPLVALNIVGFPSKQLSLDILGAILEGGARKVKEAGALIGGGHSVEDAEIKYGLAVTGEVHPDHIWANGKVRIGDALILTKPIGTGIITSATKLSKDNGPTVQEAIRWMTTLNGKGLEYLLEASVSAATDITGFGLIGHARELVEKSGAALLIDAASVPRIKGVEDYFQEQYCTRGARESREYVGTAARIETDLDRWSEELLFDPQTSGGLLVALPEDQVEKVLAGMKSEGLEEAARIGTVVKAEDEAIVRIR